MAGSPFGAEKTLSETGRTLLPPQEERERLQCIASFRSALNAILTDPALEPIALARVVSKGLHTQGVSNRDRLRALCIEPKRELCLEVLDSFPGRLRYKTAVKLLRHFGAEEVLVRPRDVNLSLATTRRVLDLLAGYLKRNYARYKKAQRDLFENHFGLVIEIAKNLSGNNGHFEDAVQEGAIGLLQAVDKASPRTDTNFSAYASYWIRKCIVDYQGGNRYLVYVPISFVRLVRKIQNRYQEQYPETTERDPARFAVQQGLTPDALQAFLALRQSGISLNEEIGDGEETYASVVPDESAVTPDVLAARRDAREYLQRALNYLTPQQRAVILLRYGLGEDEQTYSQSEVAKKIGLCFQRVSRLEAAAIERFRKLLPRPALRELLSALT